MEGRLHVPSGSPQSVRVVPQTGSQPGRGWPNWGLTLVFPRTRRHFLLSDTMASLAPHNPDNHVAHKCDHLPTCWVLILRVSLQLGILSQLLVLCALVFLKPGFIKKIFLVRGR